MTPCPICFLPHGFHEEKAHVAIDYIPKETGKQRRAKEKLERLAQFEEWKRKNDEYLI